MKSNEGNIIRPLPMAGLPVGDDFAGVARRYQEELAKAGVRMFSGGRRKGAVETLMEAAERKYKWKRNPNSR